jgi:hypothetical protein
MMRVSRTRYDKGCTAQYGLHMGVLGKECSLASADRSRSCSLSKVETGEHANEATSKRLAAFHVTLLLLTFRTP